MQTKKYCSFPDPVQPDQYCPCDAFSEYDFCKYHQIKHLEKELVKANQKNIELCGKHDDMRKERNVWADRYLLLKDGMEKIKGGWWSRGEYSHFADEQLKKAELIK